MPEGSFVGNIAKDLGIEISRLISGKARVVTKGGRQYVDLSRDKGTLVVKERIDREELSKDADWGPNAQLSYFLKDEHMRGVPLSSLVSVDSLTGTIRAVKSFDFEQLKSFSFNVTARDGGSPPLSSEVTININIQDQNDNAPQVLYPVQTGGSVVAEIVPRAADVGYLVTKVVAVDVDSGQNAWLSYKLQKATDRALFEVGLQNGEIRTVRQVTDKDAVKQKLTVVVEDNGQPSRSAVVSINVAVADSFPEVLSEFTDFAHEKQYNDHLTFYLVLALAAVSFLFITCVVVIISVKIYRWRQSRFVYQSNLPVIPYYPPHYADTGVTGTLPHGYNYEVCMTTDSRKSDLNADSGVVHALRGFDYEQMKSVSVCVKAQDGGSPPLSTNVTLDIIIQDQNDNAPQVLYPVQTGGSVVAEIVPRAADVGYLVTKVVAVDVDSGQNAWLSYKLQKATDRALFEVGLQNGEIRTVRQVTDKDAVKQKLTVVVEDNGQPSRSAVVSINVAVADIKIYRWRQSRFVYQSNLPVIPYYPPHYADTGVTGTLPHGYNYEVCMTTDSRKSDLNADSGVVHALRGFDYEQMKSVSVCVKAQDGGSPPLSTNVTLDIIIQDQNDNAPQVLYPVQTGGSVVAEIVPRAADVGYLVTKVVAVDVDSGQNAWLSYKLQKATDRALFEVGLQNGEIRTVRQVTDKDAVKQKLTVVVEDNGQPSRSAVVSINVAVADIKIYRWRQSRFVYQSNLPVIPYYPPHYADTGVTGTLPHGYNYEVCMTTDSRKSDCKFSTLGGQSVLVVDPSFTETMQHAIQENNFIEENSHSELVHCHINDNIPFAIASSSSFFSLQTEQELDRERESEYNISVICTDEGVPALSSSVSLRVQISDVNDNAPVFEKTIYEACVVENNTPGVSIFSVKASDADWNQNARVSYILEDSTVNGVSVSSYVSVQPDSGLVTAMRSFDYETLKDFHFRVKAQDGGSPPLSSYVTVKITIQDQNDNAPQLLYPVQTGGSVVAEIVPRAADVGYLVTKVVAVDVDSGQNAWLSYKLQKATDRALFEVGLQNGEIRTVRQVTDKDAVKQKLTVVVEDSGQPSRSAVVSINVAVADIKIYRWRQSRFVYQSNLPVIPYYPPHYADTGVTGTLPHGYNYEVCMTTDSRKSDSQDGGSPPLSTNVTLDIIIQDQNDNAPQVLYPVQTGGSVVAEIVPRAADVGYLVTKVVAVDMDFGQNAWLSYKLQKATDRALFEVGLQNGEIRTVRQVTDKDSVKQKLTVVVEDNGQPSRSAVVSINVAVADIKIYRWRQSRFVYQSNLPVIPYYPPHYADTGVTGTLPHGYNYEVCMTTDSRKSDCAT
ncbi:protocadherin beta-16-like [Pimephales promelas]|nr:protocadherin beta-16-like [Pimephales promelas]